MHPSKLQHLSNSPPPGAQAWALTDPGSKGKLRLDPRREEFVYEVTVTTNVSASHHLRGYKGKCENVHGHNYKVQATVEGDDLDGTGLALDFGILKGHLKLVADRFDHQDLNSCEEFHQLNPSSENLARVIFDQLTAQLGDLPVRLTSVRVWETEGNSVAYRPGPVAG